MIVVKTTSYFDSRRNLPDRAIIKNQWIQQTIDFPESELIQKDGRIRRWAKIREMDNRYLRVVLLEDRKTVRNAFFDRRYAP
jgi:hypothetical protein